MTQQDRIAGSKVAGGAAWRHWYRAAMHSAVIAGVFSAVVCALLVWNHLEQAKSSLLDSDRIGELRTRLAGESDAAKKDGIREKIRSLDVERRRQYYLSREFARAGSRLVAGGLGVFIASLSCAMACRKKLPMPPRAESEDAGDTNAPARRSVTVLGIVVALAAVAAAVLSSHPPEHYAKPAGQAQQQAGTPEQRQESPFASVEEAKKNWPRFRGPDGSGISAHTNVPTRWNGATGEGIIWKSEVPLPGENSAVAWGDRVFLTGADADRREVYCFDAESGRLLWRREVLSRQERPYVMEDTGYAAPTAAADGRRVYAVFATGDVVCFDFAGREVWTRALGAPQNGYGHASSLAMHGKLLLVQFDQGYSGEGGKSALHALDCLSGETVWQVRRDVPASWASPIVIDTGNGRQVITCGSPWVIAYDPDTGVELWRAGCLGGDVAPSPAYAGGLVFVCNAGSYAAAIDPGGEGDVTETHVPWRNEHDLPDICSPLSDGKLLFLVMTFGNVSCYDTANGGKLWEHDFETEFNSSPSLVGRNVYLMDKQGVMHIFEAARQYREAGKAELGEGSDTCPAFLSGRIFIRGKQHLFCIGKK